MSRIKRFWSDHELAIMLYAGLFALVFGAHAVL